MSEEEKLYEKIYKDTQKCGRVQFVMLLQSKEIKLNELQQENKELQSKINKINKYVDKELEKLKDFKINDKHYCEYNISIEKLLKDIKEITKEKI